MAAKLLAQEIKEQLAEKQENNETEQLLRELVKEAAGLEIQKAIGQRKERCRGKKQCQMWPLPIMPAVMAPWRHDRDGYNKLECSHNYGVPHNKVNPMYAF